MLAVTFPKILKPWRQKPKSYKQMQEPMTPDKSLS